MCTILAKAQPRSGGIGVNQHQQRLYKNDYMQEQQNVKQYIIILHNCTLPPSINHVMVIYSYMSMLHCTCTLLLQFVLFVCVCVFSTT